ncbi:MAG: hypothetical protein QW372_05320 [Nitrososphaerales archaeon]
MVKYLKNLMSIFLGIILALSFVISLNYLSYYFSPQTLTSEVYKFDNRTKMPEILAHKYSPAPKSPLNTTRAPSFNGVMDITKREQLNLANIMHTSPYLLIIHLMPFFIAFIIGLSVYILIKKYKNKL